MAELLLFHHALGRTSGVLALADTLRQAGHTVHVPDLYAGRTFTDLDAGVAHAHHVGFDSIIESGRRVAEALPRELVYAGFSLGVLPAQKLVQTRPGARGALLISACVRPDALGGAWPAGVPLEIHGMDADAIFVGEGDLDAARTLVSSVDPAELFLYTGREHLFADKSLASYDEAAAGLLTQRMLRFLERLAQ